jgi:hypothetical protein
MSAINYSYYCEIEVFEIDEETPNLNNCNLEICEDKE